MFTKGKWEVIQSLVSDVYNIAADDKLVAKVPYEGFNRKIATPIDEAQANARLIAAAPELLEACKAMLEMYDDILPKLNLKNSFLDAKAIKLMNESPIKAGRAITKAEGRE